MSEPYNVLTVIPIYTDAAFDKFTEAEKMLREVAGETINVETWKYFANAPINIGGVQFIDMSKK